MDQKPMPKSSQSERRRMNRDAPIRWMHHSVAVGAQHGGDYAAALKQSQSDAFWAPNAAATWASPLR